MAGNIRLGHYDEAIQIASEIKSLDEEIVDTFGRINSNMDNIYETGWISQGADITRENYQELSKQYDVFHQKVVNLESYIRAMVKVLLIKL